MTGTTLRCMNAMTPHVKSTLNIGPQDFSGLTGQNPYWIAYRNLRETDKDRYMLSAALNYKILDWLSVSGRVRVDNRIPDIPANYMQPVMKFW